MSPLNSKTLRVTSSYGNRQYYYQGKLVKDFHTGIDLVGDNASVEVVAVEDGEVVSVCKVGSQYGQACFVRIKHSNGLNTLYYHLKSNTIIVNKGDKVKKGQKLGIIGTTGQSTGVHLHFQIDKGTSATSINPYDYVFNNKVLVEKSETPKSKNYITLYNMNVRRNAGTIYPIKLVKELTTDGRKNATSTNPNALACYKKGTIFTALEIIKNKYGTWAKTPSGYVCIIGASGEVYSKLC